MAHAMLVMSYLRARCFCPYICEKLSPWVAYLFFSSPQGEAALLANTDTTGVPAISRPTTSLKGISLIVPPKAVSERFDEFVQPLFLQGESLPTNLAPSPRRATHFCRSC